MKKYDKDLIGKVQTVSQWAREIGISQSGLCYRLRSGWSVSEALTTKVNMRGLI